MGAWAAKLWRRLLVLLIGGVIAVPYMAVIIWAVSAWNEVSDRSLAFGMLACSAVVLVLLCIPAFLAVIRALERTLAEQLLELSIPTPPRRPTWSDRLRGALFYFGHAFAGALLLITVVVVLPSVLLMVADPQQASELSNGLLGIAGSPAGSTAGSPAGNADPSAGTGAETVVVLSAGLVQILAPVILLLLTATIIAEGYFLPHYAQILLGPSAADRAELAGAERVRRFRRTVLAREVHDSIGHALTVTTMQAAVAKRALHQDQKLAEAAVDEIARTSREAVAELDHVLALLRAEADGAGSDESTLGDADALDSADAIDGAEGDAVECGRNAGDGDSESARPPRRTMLDITRLAEEARAIGHPTRLTVSGDATGLPPTVVHELHRIVREAVTNSLRHATRPGLEVAIDIGADCVQVVTRNAGAATGLVLGSSKKGRTDGKAATDEKAAGAAKVASDAKGMAASARQSRGLVGIGERAALFGGSADWGIENGQWILQVRLPYSEGKTP
ncbi:sensor histidine kinase [Brevibacterium permense]|uniref:sensor histidine kinase n=1 Tax=Brevibacterium permense TaxID=234834 RepID=UPI0021CF2AB4|nr:histidine kinase [Brevibacterium permense]